MQANFAFALDFEQLSIALSFLLILSLSLFFKYGKAPYTVTPPAAEPWKFYAKRSKELGRSTISLIAHGKSVVILNNLRCAATLLEKRWSNYSSRPERPLLHLMGRADNVGLQQYGPRLRKCRKLIHEALNSSDTQVGQRLERLIEEESVLFMQKLANAPEKFERLVPEFVASLIFKLTYGHDADAEHNLLVEETTEYTNQSLVPGRWLVDSYPYMQYLPSWVPGCGFKKWAYEARSKFMRLTDRPFKRVKDEVEAGIAAPSFVKENLVSWKDDPSMESIIAGTAASFQSAGTDTMVASILTFILMMVVHPEIQHKAYEEVSTVVGPHRLPTVSDCTSLPYLTAVMKEVHRFNPPVPMAVRSVENADDYLGEPIPRGSWLLVNIWAITHDGEQYDKPHTFSPERFLSTREHPPKDPRDIVFGFSRRRCPGVILADKTLMVVYAQLLTLFKLQTIKDENGSSVTPNISFSTGFTSVPKSFSCTFTHRSSTTASPLLGQ
ncbi:cytochrome P450 [Agrocybe pediades]|nr:cytochrome P450 [Agrocybe pediades]